MTSLRPPVFSIFSRAEFAVIKHHYSGKLLSEDKGYLNRASRQSRYFISPRVKGACG